LPVTLTDVDRIAALACLSFTEEEKETLVRDLNRILDYMAHLDAADTSAVEPLSHVLGPGNVLRDDEPGPTLPREEALRNAPARTEKFFKVPKVIGEH
jgi:aspartyl-tRNA(Asn)/glutamyl-tRNA(Gln) amidotransferase subunit C